MTRLSGKDKGARNAKTLEDFIAGVDRDDAWCRYLAPGGKRLSVVKIQEACGFTRGVFNQNAAVKEQMVVLETRLSKAGILGSSGSLGPPSEGNFEIEEIEAGLSALQDCLFLARTELDGYLEHITSFAGWLNEHSAPQVVSKPGKSKPARRR